MSDVAVTWAKAQECVDIHGRKDRNAKQTLVHLASYVDVTGEGWAAVSVLALEMDVSERSVQRGLAKLKALGLIKDTGRTRVYDKRVFPIYSLPLESGHANTMHRMAAERVAARGDSGVTPRGNFGGEVTKENTNSTIDNGQNGLARGDTCVTPTAATGDRLSPRDVAFVTPRGDTGVTQIGKINTQGLKPSTRGHARTSACEAWAAKAPERVAPRQVERAWLAAQERSGLTDEQILSAVLAAVSRDPDFARGRARGLARWLDDDCYEPWLPAEVEGPLVVSDLWSGPAIVANMVADTMGRDAVTSYLGKAVWDEERRVVQVATSTARDRLLERAGQAFKATGIGVEWAANAGVQHG